MTPAGPMTPASPTRPAGESLRYTGHLYRRAQQLHAALWLRDVSTDTTSVQFAALVVLDEHPDASQRDLGRALDLDRSTIADLVARLIRRGLIERTRHEQDRRRYVLRLTTAGREELGFLRPRVQSIEAPLTAGLSDDERVELRRLLLLVLEHAAQTVHGHDKHGLIGS